MGLSIAGFLVIAGLTGAVIAFEPELDAALNPRLFKAQAPLSQPALPLEALIRRVESANPGIAVTSALLPLKRSDNVIIRVKARDAGRPLAFDQVFVDPGSGVIRGERKWGTCCLQSENLVPFLYQVHMSLFLPDRAGTLLMGGVALLWLFDSFTGLVLAWPKGQTGRKAWLRTLTIKSGALGFRVIFDWHRILGLWPWPVLIILAMTGVSLNLRQELFTPVVRLFSPLTPGVFDQPLPGNRGPASIGYGKAAAIAVAAARSHMPDPVIVYACHVADAGVYGFAVARSKGDPRNGLGPSWYYIDDITGSLRDRQLMGKGTAGDVFMQAQLPLHNGRIAGLPGRIAISIIGILVAALSVTGVVIWWRKMSARRRVTLRYR
ncbi:PepSY-associated TM helix domain-containing protein [Asticcacaulis sp. W401b]|uniref:PepSY-associated TM helix domain-containing protein n=1 Tax=Asticcacaulis sp. W401b TaxID=3388666 RepID=UPI0039710395